jgi:hypothetical protein
MISTTASKLHIPSDLLEAAALAYSNESNSLAESVTKAIYDGLNSHPNKSPEVQQLLANYLTEKNSN